MQKPYVVAIAAVSGGGKTTVTKRLAKMLSNSAALYFDEYEFEREPDDLCEWVEHGADPGEWDLTPLVQDVDRLAKQRPPLDFIILDYPFAYSQKEMNPYIDFTVFIDTPLDIAMARRLLRDFSEGSIEEVREEMDIYLNRARLAFLHMLQTVKPDSDVIIDGTMPIDGIAEVIKNKLVKS